MVDFLNSTDVKLQQFGFTLQVDPIVNFIPVSTPSLFPHFKEHPQKIVNLTCGEVYKFSEILDYRDKNPTVSFNFNMAASFMKGSKENITIESECKAGFYPISIKVSNLYDTFTRYQMIVQIWKT